MKKFIALLHARNMEFIRDRGTLIWNVMFPVFLVFGFAFAFSGGQENLYKVGVIGEVHQEMAFTELDHLEFIEYTGVEEAVSKLRHHQIDFLVDFSADEYYVGDSSSAGYIVEQLFRGAGGGTFSKQTVTGRPIRYVDWFVPGVIGMNMMFSCLFGVGFVIVRYRKNGVLKRLKATPVRPVEFVSAQAVSRLMIVILTSVVVYTGSNYFLDFLMLGSYLDLLLVTAMAIICMIALGMIFAARIKSEELANGLMNLAIWPMIVFSGVFFSLEGTPRILQQIADLFPLTHFIESARSIMLDGAGLAQIYPHILALAGLTVIFTGTASLMFKWE
jgi:ABC-type multidrug transport system permease subunit